MIHVGSLQISTIHVGSLSVPRIDWGSDQVWPDSSTAPATTISISPSTFTLPYGENSSTNTAAVTTNASSWSLSTSSIPSGSYFSASKSGNNVIWSITANDTSSNRVGYITVTAGDASAQAVVYQNPGYYIYIEGGNNPRVVSENGGTQTFSVISKHGADNVPITCSLSETWARVDSSIDASVTGGRYVYTIGVDRSTDTQTRHCTVTFTQTQGTSPYKNTAIMITQDAMFVPDQIAGFTYYAHDGQWMLGRYKSGTTSAGQYGDQNVYAIAVLRATAPTADYTVTYDFTSSWGIPGPTNSVHQANTVNKTIANTSTVSIPDGGTGYGFVICSYPNLQPPSNITFDVS